MSDYIVYVEDPIEIIEVGTQGPQGPQGATGASGSSGTIETKTANFPAASSGIYTYRCKGAITAALPTFATADSGIVLEFKCVGTAGDALSFTGDVNIDGVAPASSGLVYREVLRIRKGETEWEVWG